MIIPNDMVNHLGKIWAGEYDIELSGRSISVLDIGANIGMFAFWAFCKWEQCSITCFEPEPSNFSLLNENMKIFGERVALNPYAVGKEECKRDFYLGKNNTGEGSFFSGTEQSDKKIEVEVISSSIIPYHDIVKIDAEGAEIEIIENIKFLPIGYLVEYNGTKNRIRLLELLDKEYILINHKVYTYQSGVMKFIKREKLK